MSDVELLDELEAGELSVEFEGAEPWELLEWALERFGDRLALSTAFQEGDVALIDMAYAIDPSVRVFSIDTGRLPQETFDLIEQLRERYPGLGLELLSPDARQVQRLVDRHGPNLFCRSVEKRLLCCNVRKVQPLTRALAGLDAWVTGLRRDQWASRSDIRKVEIDHDHGAIVKLNPLAEWTEDEVWDYLRENDVPAHPLYEQGYTSIGCAPCTRPVAAGEPPAPAAGGGRRTRRRSAACTARSRPAASSTSCTRSSARRRDELASPSSRRSASSRSPRRGRARGRARRGVPRRSTRSGGARGRPARRRGAAARAVLELGLQTGRIRAIYGPPASRRRCGSTGSCPRGAALTESAARSPRRSARSRAALESPVDRGRPGPFTLSLAAGGAELSVRLDRQGARLASVGV